jgi:hypothetical protein
MNKSNENIQPDYLNHQNEFELLSKNQARKLLRISYKSINNLIKIGYIKIIKINTRDRIPYASLREFVNMINNCTVSKQKDNSCDKNPESILEELLKEYKC